MKLAFLFLLISNITFASYGVKVGDKSPVSSLKTVSDKTVDLKKGTHVLVFYRGAWCPYCINQIEKLNEEVAPKLKGTASLLGISVDSAPTAKKMKSERKLNFDLVSDFQRMNIQSFNIVNPSSRGDIAHPSVFIIKDGIVIFSDVNTSYSKRTANLQILKFLKLDKKEKSKKATL